MKIHSGWLAAGLLLFALLACNLSKNNNNANNSNKNANENKSARSQPTRPANPAQRGVRTGATARRSSASRAGAG